MILTLQFIFLMKIFSCLGKQESNFNADSTFRDKMCPDEEVEFQTKTRSVVECVQQCSVVSACKSLVFYKGNNTCYGIKSTNAFAVGFTELSGAVFYKDSAAETVTPTSPGCNESIPMVAPLPDSQISASSEYSSYFAASRARLNDAYRWAPSTLSLGEYLQIDFSEPRVVTSVITRGDGNAEYVTTYKVLISNGCTTFTAITNATGTEKIFDGNVDGSSEAENVIEPPVVTRCLRIEAVTWKGYISLSLEAMGCLA